MPIIRQHPRVTGPITNDAAPFSPEMVQGSLPTRSRVKLGPRIGLPVLPPFIDAFSVEMAIGTQPSQSRLRRGNQRGLTLAQTTHVEAPFGQEMAEGYQPERARIKLGPRIPLPVLPPFVDAFSVEMAIGSQPSQSRVRFGNQRGLTLSQPTHVQAPFGQEMAEGWQPERSRVKLGPRIGLPVLPPFIDLFSPEMVQGWHPDTKRAKWGNQKGQTLSQTTHVNAPFGPEMVIGWYPAQQRGYLPLRVGWFAWAQDIAAVILTADACNTFFVGADEDLTVGADDTGFSVPGEDQTFDVEGCE